MKEWKITPKRYGFGSGSVDQIAGGPPAQNAAMVLDVLRGEGNAPSTAAVVLNAAAAFYVGGRRRDVRRRRRLGECGDQVRRGSRRAGALARRFLQQSGSELTGSPREEGGDGVRGNGTRGGRDAERSRSVSTASTLRRRSPESRCRSRGRTSAAWSRWPAGGGCGRRARGRTSSPSPRTR